jgi:hypothetical protein
MPHATAQTNPQLSLTLIGLNSPQEYLTPAGKTTTLQIEIMNNARSDVYLLQGQAFLDPSLNGTWTLMHSEDLGQFHLRFLQGAIWTFDLTMPAIIKATNSTNGTPQVNLLIKILYQTSAAAANVEDTFAVGVPGAIVQQPSNMILYTLAGVLVLICVVAAYVVTKKRGKP